MARFFADENFPLPGVEELRRLGHDVVTLGDVGMAGQALSDDAILNLAMADRRAVLTLNRRHFIRLHGTGLKHSGIVICTVDSDFESQAQRIHAVMAIDDSITGKMLRVNRPTR